MGRQQRPHAVVFPFPLIGHISPMLSLARMLASRDFFITFVNTEFVHDHIIESGCDDRWDYFQFQIISDGLHEDDDRSFETVDSLSSFVNHGTLEFEKLVEKLISSVPDIPPVTCIIGDALLFFVQDIANKYDIPWTVFWAASVCFFSVHFYVDLLAEKGYIPGLKENGETKNGHRGEDSDEIISCIPGMPLLRVRDLPGEFRTANPADFFFQYITSMVKRILEAATVVLFNSLEELDGRILEDLSTKFHNLAIGPLLPLVLVVEEEKSMKRTENMEAQYNGRYLGEKYERLMGREESSCLKWLDGQERCSVVYVSFGSLAMLSQETIVEFAWGLAGSNLPFLWVMRPNLVRGQSHSVVLPEELVRETRDRSFFVSWAPQLKVLSHPSVGGFLTHCGWNSVLESILAGVPMICSAFFVDQHINRRLVTQVWRTGVALDDNPISRLNVETSLKTVMVAEEGKQMRSTARDLKISTRRAMKTGGSSSNNFDKFANTMANFTSKLHLQDKR